MAGPQIPQKYLDIADKSFAKKGVYRTAFALKLALRGDAAFKKEYEAHVASQNKKSPTLSRWFKEEWVQVTPYLHDGTIIACGAERTHEHDHKGKACRPLIRVAASTPQTLHELVKECGKEAVLKEAHKKEANPDYRIAWHLLTKNGIVEKAKPAAKKAKKPAPKKATAKKAPAKKKAAVKKAAPKKAKAKPAAKKTAVKKSPAKKKTTTKKTVTRKKVAPKKKAAAKKVVAKKKTAKKTVARKKVTKVATRKKAAPRKKVAAKKTSSRKKAGAAKKVVSRKKAAPRKKVVAKAKKKSSTAKKSVNKKAASKKSSRRR